VEIETNNISIEDTNSENKEREKELDKGYRQI
jgi:hypothetical protein